MKKLFILLLTLASSALFSQPKQVMTPELLWKLGRASGERITPDGRTLIYGVSYYDIAANKSERNLYAVPVAGGTPKLITKTPGSETVLGVDATTGKITYLYKS